MIVSEQIIQIMDALCEKFGIAIDWANENVLPYMETLCQKLITYNIVTSICWIVFMLILTIASIIATKKLCPVFKKKIAYDSDWEIGAVLSIIVLIILYLIIIIASICQTVDIIKCITFPEMYIIEYVRYLMV